MFKSHNEIASLNISSNPAKVIWHSSQKNRPRELFLKIETSSITISSQFLRDLESIRQTPVWPNTGIKSCPNFPNVAQNVSEAIFTQKLMFFKIVQWVTCLLGYFCKKYCHQKLSKSPNLVTLANTCSLISVFENWKKN